MTICNCSIPNPNDVGAPMVCLTCGAAIVTKPTTTTIEAAMFRGMSDAQIDLMVDRAYYRAVFAFQEARAFTGDKEVAQALFDSAGSASAAWMRLRDARDARAKGRIVVMTTYHHSDCYRCWGDFVADENTDHACDCDKCCPMPPTEASLAARYEFEMDGGNFHSDGTYHTGDDDGYHGSAR